MQQVVRAFPILSGREEEMTQFLEELRNKRKAETDAFYRRYGVNRETAYLQKADSGAILIVVTDIDEPDKNFTEYGASLDQFEAWFKDRVESFSGINLNRTPRGPEAQRLHDWSR
jgi:hypothetical protein